jgi:major vault protein
VHVLDQNSNVTRVEVGPKTLILQDHELCVFSIPQAMIVLPPLHYIKIKNPVKRTGDGSIVVDDYGQIELKHGEEEVRTSKMQWYSQPFPLYPGEKIAKRISRLSLIKANHAFHVRVLQNFAIVVDSEEEKSSELLRSAGDEYLIEGPRIFVPNVNLEKVREISATIVKQGQALRLLATQDTIDRNGKKRVAGEEWIHDSIGAYLPGVHEKVVSIISGKVLTDVMAVHVRALRSFSVVRDEIEIFRSNGSEYLITNAATKVFFPSVNEEIIKMVKINVLTSRNYCVILDPFDANLQENRLGAKKLCTGPASFFLHPGERLQNNRIEDVFVLTGEDGVVLSATEEFVDTVDERQISRMPGDRWMIRGPMEFIPPVEATVEDKRKTVPLHENEGIYVRDLSSGRVRLIRGTCSYMLNENEELWKKELSEEVASLVGLPTEFGRIPEAEMVAHSRMFARARNKSLAVSYRVPANSCVQIYDYKKKCSRVNFGPCLVLLGPDESFTPLSLSGGCPKKIHVINTIHLMLGPDYCTDIVNVETSDHAKLNLKLSYNWRFDVLPEYVLQPNLAISLFSVSDFIGDVCKQLSSRIRGAVASVSFDDFHKNSARLIRTSVFGLNRHTGQVRDVFRLANNHLLVTGIDIKSIEPDNEKTRQALQSSVQQAIKITTDAQQAVAKQEAERLEQQAKGKLQRQKINDDADAELAKKNLNVLVAETQSVKSSGKAKAIASANATAAKIRGQSQVDIARLAATAKKIKLDAEMNRLRKQRESELLYCAQKQKFEAQHSQRMAKIDSHRFQSKINAIGAQTICAIATQGPRLQASLIQSLGIQSVIITGTKSPIHLFAGGNAQAQAFSNFRNVLPEPEQAN